MSAVTIRPWAWSLLMLAALLPTVAAPDHWGGHHEDPTAEGHHEQHCHGSPSSCSDVPLTSTTGLAFLATFLVAPAANYLRRPALAAFLALTGWVGRVPSPPPKHVLAA